MGVAQDPPNHALQKKDEEENQGRSCSDMGCWGEYGVLALGGCSYRC